MLSVAAVRSASGAANYFAKDDYYTAEHASEATAWGGEGAKELGLTGEVKKLPQAIALLRKTDADSQALEVAEIIRYKVLFASRPEPVGTTATE